MNGHYCPIYGFRESGKKKKRTEILTCAFDQNPNMWVSWDSLVKHFHTWQAGFCRIWIVELRIEESLELQN